MLYCRRNTTIYILYYRNLENPIWDSKNFLKNWTFINVHF